MKHFIDAKLNGNDVLKEVFEQVMKVAQVFANKPESMFRINEYQVLLVS